MDGILGCYTFVCSGGLKLRNSNQVRKVMDQFLYETKTTRFFVNSVGRRAYFVLRSLCPGIN